MTAMVAIFYTLLAIMYQLVAPVKNDYVIQVKATESIVSFHSLLANTNGMLAMFLWKQMIDVIRNTDRYISINYRPYLRWEPAKKEPQLVESVIPETSTVVMETDVS